ncbi:hypothetical protein CDD83_819 [Cordyceps sp. RAO-2017]|nr:hypothetical protein CDD83_819 [Cordyceps sp. RAO-2017]
MQYVACRRPGACTDRQRIRARSLVDDGFIGNRRRSGLERGSIGEPSLVPVRAPEQTWAARGRAETRRILKRARERTGPAMTALLLLLHLAWYARAAPSLQPGPAAAGGLERVTLLIRRIWRSTAAEEPSSHQFVPVYRKAEGQGGGGAFGPGRSSDINRGRAGPGTSSTTCAAPETPNRAASSRDCLPPLSASPGVAAALLRPMGEEEQGQRTARLLRLDPIGLPEARPLAVESPSVY